MSNYSNSSNSINTLQAKLEVTWDKILVAAILFSITLVTVLGNIIVLIAVRTEKKLQTIFNYYIVNLAITDVAVAVTAMSFMATHTVLGFWPFGEVLCGIWILFDYGMTFVSVFTLILISVDRFWSVTWSISYRKYHTKRKCIISLICVWLFMIVLWVPPWILDRVRYSESGICYWDPSLNKEFVFIIAILGHHGPFCIMVFCYSRVFLFMHKRAKVANINAIPSSSEVGRMQISTIADNTVTEGLPSSSGQNGKDRFLQPARKSFKSSTRNQTTDTLQSQVPPSYLPVPESSQGTDNNSTTDRPTRQTRERSVFKTLTYILAGYAILWLPFHIIFDISIVYPTLIPDQVWHMAFWMAYFNSTINPVLYNFSSPEFRQAYKRIFYRFKCL